MKRILYSFLLLTACAALVNAAEEPVPRFLAADVHASAGGPNSYSRSATLGTRYDIKNASMVNLISMAYGVEADKILGGPNWVEWDRFDIAAKLPEKSAPEDRQQMLQVLLKERFKLEVHKDTRPLPVWVLSAGKKPLLKEADGSDYTGCRPQSSAGDSPSGVSRMMTVQNGNPIVFDLGPGMTIQYHCRNMSMEAFASNLRGLMGANLGSNPVLDQTGIKGNWNFDLKWSVRLVGLPTDEAGPRITLAEAVEKQLGLQLEQKEAPREVLVLDAVNHAPTPNPPGTAEALPKVEMPKAFDVASIKPSSASSNTARGTMARNAYTANNMQLSMLVATALNSQDYSSAMARMMMDGMPGLPSWASSARFDIQAKVELPQGVTALDSESQATLLRQLLVDRFKLKYHTEDRPATVYTLTAAKPKLKKADPASRTWCKSQSAPAGSPQGSQVYACQNVTVAQFASALQSVSSELTWPVRDATGVEGSWDIAIVYTSGRSYGTRAADGGGAPAVPTASDPTGGTTLFEAIEKQLGLKLTPEKQNKPAIVIDHIEQQPTEN